MPSVNDNQPTAPQQEGTHKDAKNTGSREKYGTIINNIINNGSNTPRKLF